MTFVERLRNFDGIVPSVACILTKQHGVGGGKYHKILKISPEAYIFQRPFLRGIRCMFGGAYLRRQICVSKSFGAGLIVVSEAGQFSNYKFIFGGAI